MGKATVTEIPFPSMNPRDLSDEQLQVDYDALRDELMHRASRKRMIATASFRVGDRVRCGEGKDSKWSGSEGIVTKINSTTVIVTLDGGRGQLRSHAALLVKI
ncbi:MAG: hypothetical protein NVSMB59_23190 [Vulcanimicrobiaceae bacterium]